MRELPPPWSALFPGSTPYKADTPFCSLDTQALDSGRPGLLARFTISLQREDPALRPDGVRHLFFSLLSALIIRPEEIGFKSKRLEVDCLSPHSLTQACCWVRGL